MRGVRRRERRLEGRLGRASCGALLFLAAACVRTDDDRPTPHRTATGTATQAPARVAAGERVGYPRAPWRIRREETNRVLLRVAHVVVAHHGSRPEPPLWTPEPTRPRTREEAQRLADDVLRRLRASPESFGEEARARSDDRATAAWGGELGARRASELPDEFLDALDQLRSGEISRVVETTWGFHVLRRLPPPGAAPVAGAHVVIKHDASLGEWRADRERPKRSRAEAEQVAREVARHARESPEGFDALVRSRSDAIDWSHGGDLGAWSPHDGGTFALVVHALAALDVGAVSAPVEDAEGFHVLRRTADVRREPLAAREIVVSWRGAQLPAGSSPPARSRDEARSAAASLSAALAASPGGFDAAQRRSCDLTPCAGLVASWTRGRAAPAIEDAVLRLRAGDVAPEPVETPLGFHVLQRLEPRAEAPQPVTFELPRPEPRRLEDLVAVVPPDALRAGAQELAALTAPAMFLSQDEAGRFHAVFEHAAAELRRAPARERGPVVASARDRLRELLGAERYRTFEKLELGWVKRVQLGR